MTQPLGNKILLGVLAASTLLSAVQLATRAIQQAQNPNPFALHSLAAQFSGVEKMSVGLRRAGYFTDKNLDIPLAIAQFEQAQYMLAPTVLELNNTSLPLVIFDCTTPQIALEKIRSLGLVPLSASNTGIILAVNPKAMPR